jgi:hypothetical protein
MQTRILGNSTFEVWTNAKTSLMKNSELILEIPVRHYSNSEFCNRSSAIYTRAARINNPIRP